MIAHFTTVHPRDDSRIISKQLPSLARVFGETTLFVQDGRGNSAIAQSGVRIVDTGPRLPRIKRMLFGGWRMFQAVRRARPKVAQFHDPELIPWAVLLRCCGIRIIYDVHEDYPEAIKVNHHIPAPVRMLLSPIIRVVETVSAWVFSGIITATPDISARFPDRKTATVCNFPQLEEFHEPGQSPMAERPKDFAYIGTLTLHRNIIGMMEGVAKAANRGARLRVAGEFTVAEHERVATSHPAWPSVKFDGWVSRTAIADILANSRAGLLLIQPVRHEMVGLPIKLFEYMAAGLPVIASDFPLWRKMIDEAGCGLLVDPEDHAAIGDAIAWILDHPEEAAAMGARGRAAVIANYSWASEEQKLLALYQRILR
jgi:glycosyltransferase involved in cell wall biosynthesis